MLVNREPAGWRHCENGIPAADDQAGSVEQQPRGRVCISSMPHFSEQADNHFISAERNAAHVRSLQRRHDDIHISSQCLTVVWPSVDYNAIPASAQLGR